MVVMKVVNVVLAVVVVVVVVIAYRPSEGCFFDLFYPSLRSLLDLFGLLPCLGLVGLALVKKLSEQVCRPARLNTPVTACSKWPASSRGPENRPRASQLGPCVLRLASPSSASGDPTDRENESNGAQWVRHRSSHRKPSVSHGRGSRCNQKAAFGSRSTT